MTILEHIKIGCLILMAIVYNIGIDTQPLNAKTREEAQEKAIEMVRTKVKRWHNDLSSVI